MATKQNKPVAAKAEASSTTVTWDDSSMKSSYANVCNVASTREEVTLLFGTNQNWHTGQKSVTVELNERIILNPAAAKRLSELLNKVTSEYESRFGSLSDEAGTKH